MQEYLTNAEHESFLKDELGHNFLSDIQKKILNNEEDSLLSDELGFLSNDIEKYLPRNGEEFAPSGGQVSHSIDDQSIVGNLEPITNASSLDIMLCYSQTLVYILLQIVIA